METAGTSPREPGLMGITISEPKVRTHSHYLGRRFAKSKHSLSWTLAWCPRVSVSRRRHPARMADTRCSTLLHEWSQAVAFHIIIPSLLRLEQAANALHHLEKLPPLVVFGSPVQTLPTGRVWQIFPMHHLCYRGAQQARAATSL